MTANASIFSQLADLAPDKKLESDRRFYFRLRSDISKKRNSISRSFFVNYLGYLLYNGPL